MLTFLQDSDYSVQEHWSQAY